MSCRANVCASLSVRPVITPEPPVMGLWITGELITFLSSVMGIYLPTLAAVKVANASEPPFFRPNATWGLLAWSKVTLTWLPSIWSPLMIVCQVLSHVKGVGEAVGVVWVVWWSSCP